MKRIPIFAAIFALVLTASMGAMAHAAGPQTWVASWGASQQIPEPQNALAPDDLADATVRQIFHLSVGGTALRVHLSNAFGTTALHVTAAHIARPVSRASAEIVAGSDKALTFAGNGEVTIPPAANMSATRSRCRWRRFRMWP